MSDYTREDYDQDRADEHTEQVRALVEQRAEMGPDTPWPDDYNGPDFDEWAEAVADSLPIDGETL